MTPTPAPRSRLHRLRSFMRRSWRDQWLFAQAFILLGLARLAINLLKFQTLAKRLGVVGSETPATETPERLREARRIGWAVRSAARFTPWKSNCFPQAVAAKYLLGRRGISSTLYLGAAFKARSELEAHAWLRCGPVYVTGGRGETYFGIVGKFG